MYHEAWLEESDVLGWTRKWLWLYQWNFQLLWLCYLHKQNLVQQDKNRVVNINKDKTIFLKTLGIKFILAGWLKKSKGCSTKEG